MCYYFNATKHHCLDINTKLLLLMQLILKLRLFTNFNEILKEQDKLLVMYNIKFLFNIHGSRGKLLCTYFHRRRQYQTVMIDPREASAPN
jgi:hypothetical protein